MNTSFEDLARRAVACKHWRWMDGMKVIHAAAHEGATGYTVRLSQDGYIPAGGDLPDLSDPATVGCLLHLVRTWIPDATTATDGEDWWIADLSPALPLAKTEVEALVVALEAAPPVVK